MGQFELCSVRRSQELRSQGSLIGLSSVVLHLRGSDLVLSTGYLRPSVGPRAGPNVERLRAWVAWLSSLADPWVFCEWNCSPTQLVASGWLALTGGSHIIQPDIGYTSRSGEGGGGQIYDLVVCSQNARAALGAIRWDSRVPLVSHRALSLEILRRPLHARRARLALPLTSARAPPAPTPPDPLSKASRNKFRLCNKAVERNRGIEEGGRILSPQRFGHRPSRGNPIARRRSAWCRCRERGSAPSARCRTTSRMCRERGTHHEFKQCRSKRRRRRERRCTSIARCRSTTRMCRRGR